jgi:hypothetical protein
MDQDNGITLRELNQKLAHEREMVNEKLKDVDKTVKFHVDYVSRALDLQAKEYERRLMELQHRHDGSHVLSIIMWAVVLCGVLFLIVAALVGGHR